jgi:hypothetical protein
MGDTLLNTRPIYSALPNLGWAKVSTVNTTKTGTGTVYTVFTADATNGGRISHVRIRAYDTNGVTTVLRVFINNGGTNATASNNTLYTEAFIDIRSNSLTSADYELEVPLNLALPAGYKVFVTLSNSIGSFFLFVTGVGGKY